MATPRTILKEFFEAYKKPTEAQFAALIDSFVHLDDDLASLVGSMAELIEAQQGNVTDKYMSPYLTKVAIYALTRLVDIPELKAEVDALIAVHVNAMNNPHGVTKTQVGLSEIPNAITNSTNVDDGAILATAKAVNALRQACEPTIGAKLTAFNKNFGTATNTVAEGSHQHLSLHYSGSARVTAADATVSVYRRLRIYPDSGASSMLEFKPYTANNNSTAVISRDVTAETLDIRVDKSDGVANYDGMFQFKENGDMTFSSLDSRIRDRVTGTVIGSTSDKRLKRNIETIEGNLIDKVKQLRPVLFLFKSEQDKDKTTPDRIGFISQEVEEIFPSLVDTSEKGYKSIDYPKMTVVLTKTIQEQQVQIDFLMNKIKEIESRLNAN